MQQGESTSGDGGPSDPRETRRPSIPPSSLLSGAAPLDDREALQWLGHVQRLASTGLLAGGMAHDLAGLIQPLLSEADTALLGGDDEDYREALVRIRASARRCEEYVRALLDLVRRDEHHRIAVSVEGVVEDSLRLLESAQRTAGVSITRRLDNRHIALVDRTRLMQAIVNVVTNAVRAASCGGREVELRVFGRQDFVIIEVEDNGPGVPEEIRDSLFEPFVHGDPRAPAGGPDGVATQRTGLGLYITKRLIEEQGGQIEYGTSLGVGSVFRIMLEPAPRDGDGARSVARNEGVEGHDVQ